MPDFPAFSLHGAPSLLLATHNRGKAAELSELLQPFGIRVTTSAAEQIASPEEIHDTFEGNALLKAHYAHAASGLWTLADDSGLEVDALGGGPGVYTADYGGFQVLLETLKDVPKEQRGARFVCVLALCAPSGEHRFFRGECRGSIALEPIGTGGFGHDPVFIPEGETRTFAEMTSTEKYAYSHRGQAMNAFLEWLKTHAA